MVMPDRARFVPDSGMECGHGLWGVGLALTVFTYRHTPLAHKGRRTTLSRGKVDFYALSKIRNGEGVSQIMISTFFTGGRSNKNAILGNGNSIWQIRWRYGGVEEGSTQL